VTQLSQPFRQPHSKLYRINGIVLPSPDAFGEGIVCAVDFLGSDAYCNERNVSMKLGLEQLRMCDPFSKEHYDAVVFRYSRADRDFLYDSMYRVVDGQETIDVCTECLFADLPSILQNTVYRVPIIDYLMQLNPSQWKQYPISFLSD